MGGSLGQLQAKRGRYAHELGRVGGVAEPVDDGQLSLGIDEQNLRRIEPLARPVVERGRNLRHRSDVHLASMELLERKLGSAADDVVWTLGDDHAPLFVLGRLGPGGLIGALGQHIGIGDDGKDGAEALARCDNAGGLAVLADGEQGHTTAVNTPSVHMHGLELGGDARLEDVLLHIYGNTAPVVDDDQGAVRIGLAYRKEDVARAGIAGVAQKLDNDVLDMLDIVPCLATLSLGHAQADEALTQVLLDAQIGLSGHLGDKRDEFLRVSHRSPYLAMSTARLSRMTTTRTWPGYSISSSI